MKPKTNILFVCKYNRFRSKIAESYFNKINKNPRIKAKSAGIIVGSYPLDKEEVEVAKKLGIKLYGKPEPITTKALIWQNLLIIVANNVPKKIFKFNKRRYYKETRVWKIKDIKADEGKRIIEKRIRQIIRKVDQLNSELSRR